MPARIVVVHDDPDFREGAVTALAAAGYDIAVFTGSMEALGAFEVAERIELLITGVVFPEGTPNGVSLARMAKMRKPGIPYPVRRTRRKPRACRRGRGIFAGAGDRPRNRGGGQAHADGGTA
jgi:DNA-binding NtrC family response regulator